MGTIACSRITFDSAFVQESICPDDFDRDSIIDNLDIDNDGVLNCDKSIGDVQIDLSDPLVPALIFQDGMINENFTNASINASISSGNITNFTR